MLIGHKDWRDFLLPKPETKELCSHGRWNIDMTIERYDIDERYRISSQNM